MFIINELSPEERFKPDNIILGGLWGCDVNPHPNVFLKPIYQEVMKLKEGFNVTLNDSEEEYFVHAHVIAGTCDVPAKACFTNMKGHTGYNSCPRCLIRGEKSPRTGNVMVFPHQQNLVLRNEEHYRLCVNESLRQKDGSYLGVNGPSLLSYMTYTDFLSSISIDSMHCIYIGVVKQMMNLWFCSTYSSEPFSINQMVNLVNERLFSLQLPHFVQRLFVGVDKLAFWKASMYRSFLLYVSLLVMKGILTDEYYNHFTLLVNGISILNTSSISENELSLADQLLCQFCADFQKLYGLRFMTSNLHLLSHLSLSVRENGNLWATSCFQFENLNGKLSNLAHGTTHASLQIYSRFSLMTELPEMVSKIASISIKYFCSKVMHSKYVNTSEKICENTYVVGKFGSESRYCDIIVEKLTTNSEAAVSFQTFSRIYRKRKLYVSSSYTRGLRLSSYCKYLHGNIARHGNILTFVKTLHEVNYFALISRSVSDFSVVGTRYYEVQDVNAVYDFVPVSSLINVSFCIGVKNKKYIVDPLNSFEME